MGMQCVRKRKMFVLFVYTVIFINIVKYIFVDFSHQFNSKNKCI